MTKPYRSYQRRERRVNNLSLGCMTALGIAVVAGVGSCNVYAGSFYGDRWRTCTIESKDRGMSSDGSSHYRIYTTDCGVFADSDSLLRGKNNSADVYGQIQPGHVYRLHVVGYRLGFGSHFPNILAAQEVK